MDGATDGEGICQCVNEELRIPLGLCDDVASGRMVAASDGADTSGKSLLSASGEYRNDVAAVKAPEDAALGLGLPMCICSDVVGTESWLLLAYDELREEGRVSCTLVPIPSDDGDDGNTTEDLPFASADEVRVAAPSLDFEMSAAAKATCEPVGVCAVKSALSPSTPVEPDPVVPDRKEPIEVRLGRRIREAAALSP